MTSNVILVTGASGFVGRSVCLVLSRDRMARAASRGGLSLNAPGKLEYAHCELAHDFDWRECLRDVSTVVHCAARVHILVERVGDAVSLFRAVNVDGTLNLARQAAAQGVRRFIFLSSIGVNGAETFGFPFDVDAKAKPHSAYALSKYEAEFALQSLARESGMEVVIIRPPMVYGPDAPGNFGRLMKWMSAGVPLPLGALSTNRRSLVFLENLVDLIVTCIDHPAAAHQTFLVSDDEDLSTSALLRRMGVALGKPARLIPVPAELISLGAKLIGRPGIAQGLCGSLQVDIGKTKALLGWSPPISVDEGLRRTAEHWIGLEQASRG